MGGGGGGSGRELKATLNIVGLITYPSKTSRCIIKLMLM